jgi:hypothetical protein
VYNDDLRYRPDESGIVFKWLYGRIAGRLFVVLSFRSGHLLIDWA